MRLMTDELNNCFATDTTLNNSKQNFVLKTKSFCFENQKNVIVGQLNINSLRNKFVNLRKSLI